MPVIKNLNWLGNCFESKSNEESPEIRIKNKAEKKYKNNRAFTPNFLIE